jgi:hypothetical protein
MKSLEIMTPEGSILAIIPDSNREYPDYIQVAPASGRMFAVFANDRKLRTFLRRTLRRLEKDATRRGEKP